MKRRNKKIGLIALLLVCIFTLSACKKKRNYPIEFDQEQVEELAISVVDMVNKEDAEGIKAISNEEMKQAMTDDILNKYLIW